MFKSHGMVLSGGVEIGLGQVAGIACLGEQCQIGELQGSHQSGIALARRQVLPLPPPAMADAGGQQNQVDQDKEEKPVGATQTSQSSPRRICGVISA
jgi:hypothetical protein